MIELGFYERVVRFPNRGAILLKKLLAAVLSAVIIVGWMIFGFMRAFNPGLIIFVAVIPALIGYFAFVRSDVEFEYAINDSLVTLARIYSKSRRKTVFEVEGKDILFVAPATNEGMARARTFSPEKSYEIVTGEETDTNWVMIFEGEKGERYLFLFTAEKEITKILKILKPSALVLRP